MGFFVFRTPKPKEFKYSPRYFDPKKEELERRKAELGLKNELSHNEELRLKISHRWRKSSDDDRSTMSKTITYLIYGSFIVLSIYFILFTDVIENVLRSFGVVH